MASLVTAGAGAMYGYGEEGKQEIEDKMAGLNAEEAEGEMDKGTGRESEVAAGQDEDKREDDLEKLSKTVVQESQEPNLGEAERETKVDKSPAVAPEA